jgi:hypothetical protein
MEGSHIEINTVANNMKIADTVAFLGYSIGDYQA